MQWTPPFHSFLLACSQARSAVFWIAYSWGGIPTSYCSCLELWNFYSEKKQLFKYLTAFVSCFVVVVLLLCDLTPVGKWLFLSSMHYQCFHMKLLLKWEDTGSERVIWLHCGKHLDCVNFFPLVFTFLLIFFKSVFFRLFRKA